MEEKDGWLFSGDVYLASRIKYFQSDERLNDQIAFLKKVLEFDFEVLFCAHNPCLGNGKSRMITELRLLEDLYGNIHMLIQKGFSEREVIKKWIQKVTGG